MKLVLVCQFFQSIEMAVVVAQLAERSLSLTEFRGSNPVKILQ